MDSLIIKELADLLCKSSPLANTLGKGGPLATAYKRKEYYKEVFKVVEAVEFVLDNKKNVSFQSHYCVLCSRYSILLKC